MEQLELAGFDEIPRRHSSKCLRCGRVLKDAKSIERGMGKVCAAKIGQLNLKINTNEWGGKSMISDRYTDSPLRSGIVLERTTANVIKTNVPHLAVHHSPDGYEFGYMGSGPADLALNIVENVLRMEDYTGTLTERLWDGSKVFAEAFRLHQNFKQAFLSGISREPGRYILEYTVIQEWITTRLRDTSNAAEVDEYGD